MSVPARCVSWVMSSVILVVLRSEVERSQGMSGWNFCDVLNKQSLSGPLVWIVNAVLYSLCTETSWRLKSIRRWFTVKKLDSLMRVCVMFPWLTNVLPERGSAASLKESDITPTAYQPIVRLAHLPQYILFNTCTRQQLQWPQGIPKIHCVCKVFCTG